MPVSPQEMELLARQINQAHRAAVHARLCAAGLSEVGHPMLLSILESTQCVDGPRGCHAQRELADLLHISPAAVANSLKSLEKGGYIRRQPSAGDARRNHVLLTEKGAEAVRSCHQIFEEVANQTLEGFSQEEKVQLLSFRRRMLHNLRGEVPASKEEE